MDVVLSVDAVHSVDVPVSIDEALSVDVPVSIDVVLSVVVPVSVDVVLSVDVALSVDVVISVDVALSVVVLASVDVLISVAVLVSVVAVEEEVSVMVELSTQSKQLMSYPLYQELAFGMNPACDCVPDCISQNDPSETSNDKQFGVAAHTAAHP